jgi:cytidine deaminase
LFKALTEGHKDFVAVAVVPPVKGGACRQLLAEYAPNAKVWTADSRQPKRIQSFTVRSLLPKAFRDVPTAA